MKLRGLVRYNSSCPDTTRSLMLCQEISLFDRLIMLWLCWQPVKYWSWVALGGLSVGEWPLSFRYSPISIFEPKTNYFIWHYSLHCDGLMFQKPSESFLSLVSCFCQIFCHNDDLCNKYTLLLARDFLEPQIPQTVLSVNSVFLVICSFSSMETEV